MNNLKYVPRCFAVCIACFALIYLNGCDQSKGKQAHPPVVPAIKLSKSTIPLVKEYIGTSQSIAEVGIRARVKGFLDEMNFIEGKPVLKNQLLFVIDPKPFQAKVDQAQGDLTKALAAKEYQRVEYERMQVLIKKGDVSQARHDQVEAQYKSALGDVQVAQATLDDAQINLGYTAMHAPFDGIIGKRYVDVGNLVGGADETLLANVVQLNPIYVLFYPSVNDFSEMLAYRENMPFQVTAKFPQRDEPAFEGQVDLINNEADVSTSTILMRATINNPNNLLLPGIYLNVQVLLTKSKQVLLLPSRAVLDIQGQQSVFVVNEGGVVENRKITTGGEYQQQFIIQSGIKENEVVVTDGIQKLRPGMRVTPQIAKGKQTPHG